MARSDFPDRPVAPVLNPGVFLDAPDLGDGAMVRLIGARPEHEWGPCPWMPRGDVTPQIGDRCLVAQDARGGSWIVVWEPA